MNGTLVSAGIVFIAAAIIGGGVEAFGIRLPLLNSIKRQLMLASFGGLLLIVAFAPDALRQKTPASHDGSTPPASVPASSRRQEGMSAQSSFDLTLAELSPDNQHHVTFAIVREGGPIDSPPYMLRYDLNDLTGGSEHVHASVSIGDSAEALYVVKHGLSDAQINYLAGPVTEKALHIAKERDMVARKGEFEELYRAIRAVVLDVR